MLFVTLSLYSNDNFTIKINQSRLTLKYLNKSIIIEKNEGDDCERYTTISDNFYKLPKDIQKKVIKVAKKNFIISDIYDKQIQMLETYLYDKSCDDIDGYFDYQQYGTSKIEYTENDVATKKLIKKIRKKLDLKEVIGDKYNYFLNTLYPYQDKLGKHYILEEQYQLKNSITSVLKLYSFLEKRNLLEWKIRDFSINGTNFYIFLHGYGVDLDKDGIVDPIVSYWVNGNIKILIFYNNKKIAIRTKNMNTLKETKVLIDEAFYKLPKNVQLAGFNRLKNLLQSEDIALILNYKEALKNKTLIMTDEQNKFSNE